jgi:hypothetical protein
LRHGAVAFLTLLTFIAIPAAAQADSNGDVPGIAIDKTVYAGYNNGNACPGVETLQAPAGTATTYCFTVTNTGATHLTSVTLNDPALGITQADMTLQSGNPTLLAPGASVVWYYETTLDEDLVNVASTTGLPSDEQGNPDPSASIPTDEDSASVEVESSGPDNTDIRIDKTVYEGHDAGVSCPGGELVTAATGTPVTYCFVVTNTGDAWLDDVMVDDLDLGIDQADMTLGFGNPQRLAPEATVIWYYETFLVDDLINTATTTGTPTDEGGIPVDLTPPTDVDEAEVEEESQPITTDIQIDKTVYEGHNGGAACPGGEVVLDEREAPITYCFVVTNTGEAHLADVTVDDPDLGITDAGMTLISGNPVFLAPGASAAWYYETELFDDLVNTASTTGTPTNEAGVPYDIPKPTDEDNAEVVWEEVDDNELLAAEIAIDKTVYSGHDSGSSCLGKDFLLAPFGADITYCFEVTNTGEAHLADVTVDDPDLGITDAGMTLISGNPVFLAPGASAVWYYETTLDTDLVNVASTTGTPQDEAGVPVNVPKPTDSDDAEVRGDSTEEVTTDIRINKTVYEGHDAGASCPGEEEVYDSIGTKITYCFTVTNTGEVHLANVTVRDPDLGITQADMKLKSGNPALLAPGDSVVWFYETTLDDDLINTASTTGTPSDSGGNPIDLVAPVDSDSARVGELEVKQEEVLPATGLSVGQFGILGAMLLLMGATLVVAVERRRAHVVWRPIPRGVGHPIEPANDRRHAPSRRLRL